MIKLLGAAAELEEAEATSEVEELLGGVEELLRIEVELDGAIEIELEGILLDIEIEIELGEAGVDLNL